MCEEYIYVAMLSLYASGAARYRDLAIPSRLLVRTLQIMIFTSKYNEPTDLSNSKKDLAPLINPASYFEVARLLEGSGEIKKFVPAKGRDQSLRACSVDLTHSCEEPKRQMRKFAVFCEAVNRVLARKDLLTLGRVAIRVLDYTGS